MVELGLAVALGIIKAIVQHPTSPALRMDIQARNQPDAVDDTMLVAAPLPLAHFNTRPKSLVQNGVIKHHVSGCIKVHDLAGVLPQQAWRQYLTTQIAVDGIVAPTLKMLGQISQCVIDLAANQKLAIIQFAKTHNFSFAPLRA